MKFEMFESNLILEMACRRLFYTVREFDTFLQWQLRVRQLIDSKKKRGEMANIVIEIISLLYLVPKC